MRRRLDPALAAGRAEPLAAVAGGVDEDARARLGPADAEAAGEVGADREGEPGGDPGGPPDHDARSAAVEVEGPPAVACPVETGLGAVLLQQPVDHVGGPSDV